MKLKNTLIAALILGCTACSEEKIPTYKGDNYLHFTYNDEANQTPQKVVRNFAYDAPLDNEMWVPVELTLWGHMLQSNLSYKVSVVPEETTATTPTNYEAVSGGIFRKEYPVDTLFVKVKRNPELLQTDYKIKLQLDPAAGYTIGPREFSVATLEITDQVSEPTWWQGSPAAKRLGIYYPIKYRLFIIFMEGKILKDLNDYSAIQFGQIITNFKAWWITQWNAGKYNYYVPSTTTPLYETIED